MRHYVLTRSCYGPTWTEKKNRRRLDLLRGITARSLASQTERRWEWAVCLDPSDPLVDERRAVLASCDNPIRIVWLPQDAPTARPEAAIAAYRAPWVRTLGLPSDEHVLTTRIDDDDAFAPDALARIRRCAEETPTRTRRILMLPAGIRVWRGRYQPIWHGTNAFATLETPPGDRAIVYSYRHRKAASFAPIRIIDDLPAWLWVRHDDTLSGHKAADRLLGPGQRRLYSIDWTLLDRDQPRPGERIRRGKGRFV